jgi:hypothetical protein
MSCVNIFKLVTPDQSNYISSFLVRGPQRLNQREGGLAPYDHTSLATPDEVPTLDAHLSLPLSVAQARLLLQVALPLPVLDVPADAGFDRLSATSQLRCLLLPSQATAHRVSRSATRMFLVNKVKSEQSARSMSRSDSLVQKTAKDGGLQHSAMVNSGGQRAAFALCLHQSMWENRRKSG